MNNPNKHIRKYFFDSLNESVVNEQTIKCFDSRQATYAEKFCFLMLDQNNSVEDETKCNIATLHNFTIEVIQKVQRYGNEGSRLDLDDATDLVYQAMKNITIPNYHITQKSISDNSVTTYDETEILNRNVLTLTFKIS